jgi:hypothetical protein
VILPESDPACTLCSSPASLLEEHHREIVEGSGVGEELARAHFFSVTAAEAQPNTAPTTPLKAALALARNGKPVFPCRPGGKEPLPRS